MAAPVLTLNGRWGGKLRDQSLDIVSGDSLTLQVTVLNIDDTVKDLTGGTVLWVLSRHPGTSAVASVAGTLSDPTNGVFQIVVTGTSDISGEYYHETQFTESGGSVGTVMRGPVMIAEDSA